MRRAGARALVLMAVLAALARSLPNDPPALRPHPGTGMFLMLSDIHFDPYADPAIMKQLGATPLAACQAATPTEFSKYASDTNYPLLKSTLDNVAATAAANHFHYDYVMVTGDFLAHDFDDRFRQCVGGGPEAFEKFAANTLIFADGMIAKALPGVPVFAALGNNDSDKGDYKRPTESFLQSVGKDWSRAWGKLPAGRREIALASFDRAGNYALPHPGVPNHEFVILNSNLWSANNTGACGDADPDPGGQFQWLGEVLGQVKRAGGTATLIMHILPGIDALKSSMGEIQTALDRSLHREVYRQLERFPRRGARDLRGPYSSRRFPPPAGPRRDTPLAIHVVPAVSPVYLNNPAVEIGWYDKSRRRTEGLRAVIPGSRQPPACLGDGVCFYSGVRAASA